MRTLFFRNRQLLTLALIVLAVGGLAAVETLPRQEDPRLTPRFAPVTTAFPGASAERVEALVTEKLERELREIAEIKEMTSVSRTGFSFISLELADAVLDPDPIWSKIRDRLRSAETDLPPGAGRPELDDERFVDAFTAVVALTWESASPPEYPILGRVAEALGDRLRLVPGTDYVNLYGEPTEEITVTVDPDELAAIGLTAQDLSARIAAADSKVSAGALRTAERNALIEVRGALDSLERIARIPLRGGDDGDLLRLDDVATIAKSERTPATEISLVDGERAVLVAARMQGGQRVDRWSAQIHTALDQFESELSPGTRLQRLFDQNDYTETRLTSLTGSLLLGAGIVILILLVTMGWRSALVVGAALPLTSSSVLLGLQILGIPLHQMSITGLIIALGLLIDNAIVVTDEVRHRISEGATPLAAIDASVRLLFVPLLGSTLTTILAFSPILLLTGPVGEFVGPIAISVVLSIASSFLISMTIIAALSGLVGSRAAAPSLAFWRGGLRIPALTRGFESVVRTFVRHPVLGIVVGLSLPLFGFLRAGELRDQFFPPADRDQFHIEVRLPTGVSIDRTRAVVDGIDRKLRGEEKTEQVFWVVGGSAPSIYYNMQATEDETPGFAQAIVRMESGDAAHSWIPELQRELDAEFSTAQIVVHELGQGPPIPAPIVVRVYGPDLARLRALGEEVRTVLAHTPGVLHTRTLLEGGVAKVWVNADEGDARRAGLTLQNIAEQLSSNLEGTTGGSLLEQTEDLPVRVRFSTENRGNLGRIASLPLVTGTPNEWVPLSALGSVTLRPELGGIPHRNGERYTAVMGYTEAGTLPMEVLNAFRTRLDDAAFRLPPGYRMGYGGDQEESGEATGKLLAYVPILLLLMGGTIVLSFRSFLLAFLIGGVAIASVGLSTGAIWVSGYPFGFMAMIGTAGLIGVAINDSIVVLAALRANATARRGDRDAIVDVVLQASRHIFSTTFTTIGGFLPLFVAGGGFWPPLAVVIAGGVTGATILALVFVPSVYTLLGPRLERGATETTPEETPILAVAGGN